MRIGLIADTHIPGEIRSVWPEVRAAFRAVDLILHAGDITAAGVLDWLQEVAPVVAAAGNNDIGLVDSRVSPYLSVAVDGWPVFVAHQRATFEQETLVGPPGGQLQVLVCGHTHVEAVNYEDPILYVNPGSPTHPHNLSARLGSVAILETTATRLRVEIVRLGETLGRRNPVEALEFSADDRGGPPI